MVARQLLTHSRKSSFKTCRKQHELLYEIGLRRIDDVKALRIGSAVHAGIEAMTPPAWVDDATDPQGAMAEIMFDPIKSACEAVHKHYAIMPESFDPYWWAIERETVLRLVCAYQWRWADAKLTTIAVEFGFQIPLTNPATGAESTVWDQAGKIDGIVQLEDGRIAIKETKTCSDDIDPNSNYWRMLRMDTQISDYIHAARVKGFDVSTVLYDVIRKPTIKPTPVPERDENGIKIVTNRNGERVANKNKTWRQTGDTELGYELLTRPMTPQEWGDKLTADIGERPDFYFARVEIARLDQDIELARQESWEIQQTIREAQRTGKHYRTVNRNSCPFCDYFDICSTNQEINPALPPEGFEIVSDKHPELERGLANVNDNCTAARTTEDAAASTACASVA